MPRIVAELLLFFVPFVAYGVWLWATQRSPWLREHWRRGPLVWLTVVGAIIVAASLAGLAGDRYAPGTSYKPAVVRDGKLVRPETR